MLVLICESHSNGNEKDQLIASIAISVKIHTAKNLLKKYVIIILGSHVFQ